MWGMIAVLGLYGDLLYKWFGVIANIALWQLT